MKVVIASSEGVPFSKTGGLADVAGALPKWLKKAKVQTCLVLPKYKITDEKKFGLLDTGGILKIPLAEKIIEVKIYKASVNIDPSGADALDVYFIGNEKYFGRDGLYGTIDGDYPDNDERFILFSKAVLELCKFIDFKPDIIHAQDWQTGLISAYLKTLYKCDSYFCSTRSLFTIHNIAYQGVFPKETIYKAGLSWEEFTPEKLEYYGKISFLKAGLVYSDAINTVSPTYAQQIQKTKEFGRGMEGLLSSRKKDLYGIINGIDYSEWDPRADGYIAKNYSFDDRQGKGVCKAELQKFLGLPEEKSAPLFGMVSRLDPQKGFDLLADIIEQFLKSGSQLVILGTGEKLYHDLLSKAAKKYKKHFSLNLAFDNALAHKIYAGSDFFVMPSRFEPCGLGQMIAARYLSAPVVMKTGGLADTISNFSAGNQAGNGIVFDDYGSKALLKALTDASKVYQKPKLMEMLIKNLDASDFSWGKSAADYISLYKQAASIAKRI